jgi:type II secretory ATPase GspE/PulE/Tfp pilus assembly ATPase PilB-like protein
MTLIRQTSVNEAAKLDFANGIRSLMRQDPDVILVGEIRDEDTAQMALRAAMTGHQVYSTLHSNNAMGAVPRLVDIGIAPEIMAGNIIGIVAQRLVRRLCAECAETYEPTDAEVRFLGLDPRALGGQTFRRAKGCRVCEGTGYRGRLGLYELFEMSTDLRDATFRGESLERIRELALATGKLQPLLVAGARKVIAGATSVNEILRVTRAAGKEDGG